jgi:CheY-like chemotaxis protein
MSKILLADDDGAMRAIIERTLRIAGHDVTAVIGGVEAVEQLQLAPGRFDLLLTDVQMPGVDGLELAKRALAFEPNLKVVLMSGYVEQLARASELTGPRVATIAKPFTIDQIRTLVESL